MFWVEILIYVLCIPSIVFLGLVARKLSSKAKKVLDAELSDKCRAASRSAAKIAMALSIFVIIPVALRITEGSKNSGNPTIAAKSKRADPAARTAEQELANRKAEFALKSAREFGQICKSAYFRRPEAQTLANFWGTTVPALEKVFDSVSGMRQDKYGRHIDICFTSNGGIVTLLRCTDEEKIYLLDFKKVLLVTRVLIIRGQYLGTIDYELFGESLPDLRHASRS